MLDILDRLVYSILDARAIMPLTLYSMGLMFKFIKKLFKIKDLEESSKEIPLKVYVDDILIQVNHWECNIYTGIIMLFNEKVLSFNISDNTFTAPSSGYYHWTLNTEEGNECLSVYKISGLGSWPYTRFKDHLVIL